MPNITISLNSATFLLTGEMPDFTVTGAAPDYPTAQALRGLTFTVGRDPWEWSSGYATRIQHELNKLYAEPGQVTEAFGRPIAPQYPITEVRA